MQKFNIQQQQLPIEVTDLSSENELKEMNTYLKDKTYIIGFTPSSMDVEVFKLIQNEPPGVTYPYVRRWFETISKLVNEMTSFEECNDIEANQFIKLTNRSKPPSKKEDNGFDLFGDENDEDDEEYEKQLELRRKAAESKKQTKSKPKPIEKSIVVIDVKPWDDTTPVIELENSVRSIEMEGLLWGDSRLITVVSNLKKLQISMVIVDDLVSLDDVEEQILSFEDYVQSMDIVSFSRV